MREMKDSGVEWIGEIPKEWKVLRNKNAFICKKELVGDSSAYTQLLSLTTKGIRKKDINNAEGKLPESFDTYQYVKENDIVMCLFDLDCSAVFSGISFYNGMISPAYKVLTCTERIFPKYAGYWFTYISHNRKFNHYAKNIRYTLSYEEFSSLPVLIPSYKEQQKIAAYIDDKCTKIDNIINKQQTIIEKLKAYKQSVITEAVTKGLNPDVKMKDSGVEWIGEIPKHWQSVKLKYCTYIRARLGWKGLKADEYVEKGFPLLSAFNIVNDKLVFDNLNFINQERYDESPEIKLSVGDIILVKDGAGIGKCAIIKNMPYPSTTNGSLAVVTTNNKLCSNFLYYYFLSSIFQKYINRLKDGMGVPHLFQSNLKEIRIVIPYYSEQQQIADYLDKKCSAIDSAIDKKQAIIKKLTEYKKSLIYEVVTGKKEINDTKKSVMVVCPVLIPTNEVEYARLLLLQKIIIMCGNNLKGRTHLMKIFHALELCIGFNFGTKYTRYTHGPYDNKIEKYEKDLMNKGWTSIKKGKAIEYKAINNTAYKYDYNRIFGNYNKEIERIINFFKTMKNTKRAEKVATLLASWNDFIIDGVTKPTDDLIINDVMTNWTENKAHILATTWKTVLNDMKQKNIVPKGYGEHTIKSQLTTGGNYDA